MLSIFNRNMEKSAESIGLKSNSNNMIRQSVPGIKKYQVTLNKISRVKFCSSSMTRKYVTQTGARQTVVIMSKNNVPTQINEFKTPSSDSHLKSLSSHELFSLGVIGFATLNKSMLDLVIKVFPFVPIWLMKLTVSSLYCGGDNFEQVRETGRRLQERGINNMMLSLTIEDAEGVKNIDIDHIVHETKRSLKEILKPNLEELLAKTTDVNSIPPGYIALKPSALVSNPHEVLLNFNDPAWNEQRSKLIENCAAITEEAFNLNQELAKKYPARKTPFFVATIDAEKYELQKAGVYELQRLLFERFNPKSAPFVSCIGTWQLYLTDSAADLAKDLKLAEAGGYKLGLKLVRGAYIHSEPKRDIIIFPDQKGTDDNYNTVMKQVIEDLLEKGENSTYGHLVVASHNYASQMMATKLLEGQDNKIGKSNIILGQLLGMSDNVTYDLINNHGAKNIIKYVPWGPPKETKDYLLRRLQENGDAVRADNGWPLVKAVARAFVGN
ncbi:LAMI_0H17414g1_1 [Lachancea mirantina]|uniref:Proline dehydrogenase n=1 Tax=Lachancea mirantina TaxID=1230905 RepID=A0A1G4KJ95_9SACH|nr:LAMI_0H17414g1_1 [Lachancea mirantina]